MDGKAIRQSIEGSLVRALYDELRLELGFLRRGQRINFFKEICKKTYFLGEEVETMGDEVEFASDGEWFLISLFSSPGGENNTHRYYATKFAFFRHR